jgi:nitrate reductase gamma subunit
MVRLVEFALSAFAAAMMLLYIPFAIVFHIWGEITYAFRRSYRRNNPANNGPSGEAHRPEV